jgi:hypothetical protein
MTVSLNERFKEFISQLPSAEVIDNLKLPSKFDKSKRADFLVENRRAILELKSLESDPEHKIRRELVTHERRVEYPLFFGEMELQKVLKHLPDGEQIEAKLFYRISRSIEQSFRDADKQIGATKYVLSCPDSYGLLVLLNEDISVLSPDVISYRVSELLTKKDSDGSLHYKNVTSVWILPENILLRLRERADFKPSIVIHGPAAVRKLGTLTSFARLPQIQCGNTGSVPVYPGLFPVYSDDPVTSLLLRWVFLPLFGGSF